MVVLNPKTILVAGLLTLATSSQVSSHSLPPVQQQIALHEATHTREFAAPNLDVSYYNDSLLGYCSQLVYLRTALTASRSLDGAGPLDHCQQN